MAVDDSCKRMDEAATVLSRGGVSWVIAWGIEGVDCEGDTIIDDMFESIMEMESGTVNKNYDVNKSTMNKASEFVL